MERSEYENISYTNMEYPFQLLWSLKYHTYMHSQVSIDIHRVDYPSKRFEVVHNSPSTRYNPHIHVQTNVDEIIQISLVVSPSPSVDRWEGEVWDMFSVYLINHLDLCHILTDYGFEGHPS
eukprot:Gb_09469 [translate_table: standard]